MRVCIPTEDDAGIESALAAHFGRAPYLTFVDLETRRVEVAPNEHGESAHGSCDPVTAIRRAGADAVICLGLGRGALSALTAARIPVFITAESITALALEALAGGTLREAGLEIACGGGSHGACGHH
jgi:predicted Fe-Mo cluster-binding NifX family protein